ncbi:metallophosphoesterase [Desemzia sp. C1]|uniref:metallophosphoesterase n=1 Tax=Desemzia TaxID=82800 RepID=UPI0016611F26|nr:MULTISPECIES: metallophosphoesterase [Desemzia]MCI3027831.1 metallophosphoesterase [Desemzia sp. C1]
MKKFLWGFIFLCLIFIMLLVHGYNENRSLDVDELTIRLPDLPDNLDQLKIVHLSDIHFPKNRIDPDQLIKETQKADPDVIFLTGDLIDRSASIEDVPLAELIRSLSQIAPTYSVSGNHETSSRQLDQWNDIMTENGAVLLENNTHIATLSGEKIAIMGVKDGNQTSMIPLSEDIKELPILLLAHRPEFFPSYTTDNPDIQPDVTFSGHAHGGQIRLPFIGGLFAPGQGFFPKYTSGVYSSSQNADQKLVVSRGIGNSLFPLRINNKPHFIVITLTNQ